MAIIKAVYDGPDRNHPITIEEDIMIRANTQHCEMNFLVYDQVRIVRNCQACENEVARLGMSLVQDRCGRVLRAVTGRTLGAN